MEKIESWLMMGDDGICAARRGLKDRGEGEGGREIFN